MSDRVICTENLSKLYRIGEYQGGYRTLRETIVNAFSAPFRYLRRHPQSSNLNPGLDSIWALKDVSFEVKRGEVVGIIGPNGAGKSTLLRILSRITEPTEGWAEIQGRVGSLLEVGTGFHHELTGRENIYLNGAILGMKKGEIDRKFDEIVAFAEIEKFIDTPVKRYSSGMRVRLAFAVAAHLEPEILLVDEVLAVGDAAFQKKCLGKMGEVAGEGRTVLFVSHNLAAIQALCTRAVLLKQGRLEIDGTADTTIQRYVQTWAWAKTHALKDRTDRRGNEKLKFTDIWFENVNGSPSPVATSGQDLRVVCRFKTQGFSSNNGVIFSVGIQTLSGEKLMLFRNDYTGEVLREIPPLGLAVCTIPRFPLMAGTYRVDIYAEEVGEALDWVPFATELQVIEGDFFGTGKLKHPGFGPFLVDHAWSMCHVD